MRRTGPKASPTDNAQMQPVHDVAAPAKTAKGWPQRLFGREIGRCSNQAIGRREESILGERVLGLPDPK